jgi:hypothetical protein
VPQKCGDPGAFNLAFEPATLLSREDRDALQIGSGFEQRKMIEFVAIIGVISRIAPLRKRQKLTEETSVPNVIQDGMTEIVDRGIDLGKFGAPQIEARAFGCQRHEGVS